MKLAIITTPDRFGLAAASKSWEAFETGCLRGIKLTDATILNAEDRPTLPSDITHSLILGPKALSITFPDKNIDKYRGQLTTYYGRLAMVSYHPTDAQDQTAGNDSSHEDSLSPDEKDSAGTQPSNYFFWIRRDTEKLLYDKYIEPPPLKYHASPNLEKFLAYAYKYLAESDNPITYLDIECRRGDHVLTCVGLAFGDSPVFVIPIYLYNNKAAYGELWKFLKLLALALTKSTVVIHNALFDLFVLARYYRIPVGHKVYDTMLAHHRFFPEIEKSLGHVISYWTYLPFHKDLAIETPRNPAQQAQLWEYNARDVYAMREIYKAQQAALTKASAGLQASVAQANAAVYPYLTAMLRALPVNEIALLKAKLDHTKRARAYKKICRILSGENLFNPGSADQCVDYFHGKLHYDVVAKTTSGKPKMDQKVLYKLRLKYSNPMLDAVIAYRVTAKEESMLDFIDYTPPEFK